MGAKSIVSRAKAIVLSPKREWEGIKTEDESNANIILRYALPFLILAAIAKFIGYYRSYLSINYIISSSILELVIGIVALVISAIVINQLANSFGSKPNLNSAFKLVVYSYTPTFLASIIANVSIYLAWVGLLGLYSVYIFWSGISTMMETPEDKKIGYVVVSALIIIIISIVLATFITGNAILSY